MTDKHLITPEQAAKRLNVSIRTLAKWRSLGFPSIPYTKIGRCVRYNPTDLDQFLTKHTINSEEV